MIKILFLLETFLYICRINSTYNKINMSKVQHLPQKFIDKLEKEPEDGMGYHIVDVHLESGVVLIDRTILNSKYLLLLPDEEIKTEEIINIV